MTITKAGASTRLSSVTARDLLARVLDEPALVEAVRHLPAAALATLVDQVGLEDAGEIVALATPEQLTGVLDADIWQSDRPGADEALDAERFAVWIEVLLESGAALAADKIVELPEELVTHALAQHVLVLDMDELGQELAELEEEEVDQVEKALDSSLCQEIDQYRVVSRRHDGWDTIITLLVELDSRHTRYARRLLERLCAASTTQIDDAGGLVDALNDAEMFASDAAADRDDRRARQGYVAPSDARAFLGLAKKVGPEQVLAEKDRDPTTRAYLREVDRTPPAPVPAEARPLLTLVEAAMPKPKASAKRGPGKQLPSKAGGGEGAFSQAMRELAEIDAAAHARELEVLAFLLNVVATSESGGGKRVDPVAAALRVAETCDRGLEYVVSARKAPGKAASAAKLVAEIGVDRLFRIGHHVGA